MLDEEMDHIIREAANNHHPVYNDKAWEKMEKQLDKHLPQNKDRRRFIFFLLFFLLLGTGLVFIIRNKPGNDKNIAAEKSYINKKPQDAATSEYKQEELQPVKEPATGSLNTDDYSSNPVSGIKKGKEEQEVTTTSPSPQKKDKENSNVIAGAEPGNDKINTGAGRVPGTSIKQPEKKKNNVFADYVAEGNDEINSGTGKMPGTGIKPPKKNKSIGLAGDIVKGNDEISKYRKRFAESKYKTKVKITTAKPFEETAADENIAPAANQVTVNTEQKLKIAVTAPGIEDEDKKVSEAIVSGTDKITAVAETESVEKHTADSLKLVAGNKKTDSADNKKTAVTDKKKQRNKFSSNIGFTFSAGPDLSFVSLNNTGKTRLTYGAGISYSFAKRFTARAGFYVSNKIYEAAPDQYHTPGGNYPYLTDIDATCKIYEIPVSLSYSFGQRKKHNWFGSLGLSSFIMKKEDYTYNYKTPAGQAYSYYYGIDNQNKHYFSVLNLSGGYQYHFTKRLSLQAEPYLQVPLGGVGYGKVKLNSAGILFTITYKPFARKN